MTPVAIAREGKTPPKIIDLGASVVSGLHTNRKQTGWVWLADSGGKPPVLCYAPHLGESCSAVKTPETEPANLLSIKPELVHWQNGGLTIEGLLYLPHTATSSAKIPLILDVHGGPHGAWEDRNDLFAAFMVGHGWAVLRPNPRGSSNYGTKFSAANKNDLGGGDYQDIMTGVDAVLAKYPLDPNRLALMGYSYGGEMAGFVEGKTDRFKAIISGAPVIDQFSEYGTEGGSWYDRWYYGKPWEHFEDAWRQSPLSGAARAKTPFMLLQGQSDHTDPWVRPRRCIARCARRGCRWNWSPTLARTMGRWAAASSAGRSPNRGTVLTPGSGLWSSSRRDLPLPNPEDIESNGMERAGWVAAAAR